MISSASICFSTPSPPQAGQAPNGLLNENRRGSISEIVKPDTGQANFSENMMRWASAAAAVASLVSLAIFRSSPSPAGGGSDRRGRSRLGWPPPWPSPPSGGGKGGGGRAPPPPARFAAD